MTGPLRRIARGLKLMWARTPTWQMYLGSGPREWLSEVGDGSQSSVVMAPLMWIARTFPEAPVVVMSTDAKGQSEEVVGHEMAQLIRRPNPFYSGKVMWMATVTDLNLDGNGYWYKVRDREDRVVELWWLPRWMVRPVGDEDHFILYYEYRVNGQTFRFAERDVVHFRFGLDPADPRVGYSPMKTVLREVYTDDEAARFTAALLRNMGVPGILVAPESGDYTPGNEEVTETKAYLEDQFTGAGRGTPLVMSGPTKVQQFGFSPEQMNLKDLRRVPEERVTAVLGVPAVVAGLGAGLDRSTFTNMGEAREMAYESNIIPSQGVCAEDLRHQLLPDFEAQPATFDVTFKLKDVRVLQEDNMKKATRLNGQLLAGGITVAEYRRELGGLPVTDEHDIYLRPVNMVAVGLDNVPLAQGAAGAGTLATTAGNAEAAARALVEAASGSGNGNGNGNGGGAE